MIAQSRPRGNDRAGAQAPHTVPAENTGQAAGILLGFGRQGGRMDTAGKTLLIVEDDRDVQDYFRFVLAGTGLDIVTAGDGAEALEILDSGRRVDLILLDVIMPVMDGGDFLRELRQGRKSAVPVILNSVDEAMSDRLKGHGPIQGVFLKGSRADDLIRLIRECLAADPRPA